MAVFSQPALGVAALVLGLAHYLRHGCRHGPWWHLGMWSAAGIALGGNWGWLRDIVKYWWIQADYPASTCCPTLVAGFHGRWLVFTGLLFATVPVPNLPSRAP